MGGNALPLALDVRDADAIEAAAVETAGRHFGGTRHLHQQRFRDSSRRHEAGGRQAIRPDARCECARSVLLVSRACVPWLLQSQNRTSSCCRRRSDFAARVASLRTCPTP